MACTRESKFGKISCCGGVFFFFFFFFYLFWLELNGRPQSVWKQNLWYKSYFSVHMNWSKRLLWPKELERNRSLNFFPLLFFTPIFPKKTGPSSKVSWKWQHGTLKLWERRNAGDCRSQAGVKLSRIKLLTFLWMFGSCCLLSLFWSIDSTFPGPWVTL